MSDANRWVWVLIKSLVHQLHCFFIAFFIFSKGEKSTCFFPGGLRGIHLEKALLRLEIHGIPRAPKIIYTNRYIHNTYASKRATEKSVILTPYFSREIWPAEKTFFFLKKGGWPPRTRTDIDVLHILSFGGSSWIIDAFPGYLPLCQAKVSTAIVTFGIMLKSTWSLLRTEN